VGWVRLAGSITLQMLFAKEPYKKRLYSAKETCNFIDATNHSHPIHVDERSSKIKYSSVYDWIYVCVQIW